MTYIENEVPREFLDEIEKAEQKVEEMTKFEKEIIEQVEDAEKKVQDIIKRIQENIYISQKKQGILKQDMTKYANCIKVDLKTIRELLDKDSHEWITELDQIKQRI